MNDVITIQSTTGNMIIDFTQKKISIDREGVSPMTGYKSMAINFNEITAIELKKPASMSLGCCTIIVNNIRYVTAANLDMTKFSVNVNKFDLLESTLRRVLAECSLTDFNDLGSVSAAKVMYTTENSPYQNAAQHDFNQRKKSAEESFGNIDIHTEAKLFAQSLELQLLKAPATAKFCSLEEMSVMEVNGIYTVSGYVDSQNSYGAMVRTPFTLKIFKTADGWKSADRFQNIQTSIQSNIHKTVAKNMIIYWIIGLILAGISIAIIYAFISNLY